MDLLINAFRRNFDKSNFLVELREHSSGKKYVRIEQLIKEKDILTEVLLSEDNLSDIIDQLKEFEYIINLDKKNGIYEKISVDDERLIISLFTKGIKIKDLSLLFRLKPQFITDVLLKNEIVIIDGIDLPKRKFYPRGKRRK